MLWQDEKLMEKPLEPIARVMDIIDSYHLVHIRKTIRANADTMIHMQAGIRRPIVIGSHAT